MGLLTDALQTIRGHKIFANDVTVKGKLRLEGEITRTRTAGFKLDMSADVDVGTLKLISEASRPGWVLSAGTAAAYTDVNFGPYRPTGTKALYLMWALLWTGNGAEDYACVLLRKNGSAVNDDSKLVRCDDGLTNLGSGLQRIVSGTAIVECDTSGIVEYGFTTVPTTRQFYLTILGYYL